MLTGEQRYRQAMKKREIVARRRLRAAEKSGCGYLRMTDDRSFLIDALDRAFAAGRASPPDTQEGE